MAFREREKRVAKVNNRPDGWCGKKGRQKSADVMKSCPFFSLSLFLFLLFSPLSSGLSSSFVSCSFVRLLCDFLSARMKGEKSDVPGKKRPANKFAADGRQPETERDDKRAPEMLLAHASRVAKK